MKFSTVLVFAGGFLRAVFLRGVFPGTVFPGAIRIKSRNESSVTLPRREGRAKRGVEGAMERQLRITTLPGRSFLASDPPFQREGDFKENLNLMRMGTVFPEAGGCLASRESADSEVTANPMRVLLCTLAFSSRVYVTSFFRLA